MFYFNVCPKCGEAVYLKLTKEQEKEYIHTHSTEKGNNDKLKSFDTLEKLFLKTGLCPACQVNLYGYKNFLYFDYIQNDKIKEFIEDTNGINPVDAIMSPAANKLNYDEKMLYIYDMNLEKELTVDEDTGEVIRIGE